jgi:hypothetical protein
MSKKVRRRLSVEGKSLPSQDRKMIVKPLPRAPIEALDVPVLMFKQKSNGAWIFSEKDNKLSALRFPVKMDDITKQLRCWAVEFQPRGMEYGGLKLMHPAKSYRMRLSTALNIGSKPKSRKVFNNKTQLIKTVERSVKLSAYSNIANEIRETYGR